MEARLLLNIPAGNGHGTPDPVWTFWRREKHLALTGIRAPDHSVRGLVAMPTALLWFHLFIIVVVKLGKERILNMCCMVIMCRIKRIILNMCCMVIMYRHLSYKTYNT
jgi:hypothetical protein